MALGPRSFPTNPSRRATRSIVLFDPIVTIAAFFSFFFAKLMDLIGYSEGGEGVSYDRSWSKSYKWGSFSKPDATKAAILPYPCLGTEFTKEVRQ